MRTEPSLRIEPARADVFDEPRQVTFHAGLVHSQRQPLVDGIADGHRVQRRTVDADNGHIAALADRIDGPVQHRCGTRLKFHCDPGQLLERVASRLTADRIDAHVRTTSIPWVEAKMRMAACWLSGE